MPNSSYQVLPHENYPPSYLNPWITHQDSLTVKLKLLTGEANIEVLNQQWDKRKWWEQYTLNIEDNNIFRREILMSSKEVPCWYARTIIPERTFEMGASIFTKLETQSLGTLIFNDTEIQRKKLLHYPITKEVIEYHWLPRDIKGKGIFWVRLSNWMVKTYYPFFLIEILLPGLEECTL